MKVFYTKRTTAIYLFMIISAFFISFSPFLFDDFKNARFFCLICIILIFFELWRMKATYVITSNEYLKINYLFIRKSIQIQDIQQIKKGKFFSSPRKLGTSNIGLLISTKNMKQILITPINEDVFVEELVKINPEIQILERT